MLVDLWVLNAELGIAAAKQPWVVGQKQAEDGNRTYAGDRRILEHLHGLASTNIELARLVASVPWFVDGVTDNELNVLRWLRAVASKDAELANLIASFPWFADESFDAFKVSNALMELEGSGIISTDIELVRNLVGLWLAYGPPASGTFYHMFDLVSTDVALARRVVTLPWLTDGVTEDDAAAIRRFYDLAVFDIGFARKMTEQSWFADKGTLSGYVRRSLSSLPFNEMALSKLTDQPWFADGLNDAEAALVATLYRVAGRIQVGYHGYRYIPEVYNDLVEAHHIQHKVVSLPLAGDVNIWVIESAPPPLGEDLLTIIEETARIAEGFLGIPFPTTDIILLVVPRGHGIRGGYFPTHMMLVRDGRGDVQVPFIPHETTHYYFNYNFVPQWLSEGGASFVEAYVNNHMDVEALADRRARISQRAQYLCFEVNRIENIRHSIYAGGGGESCSYVMGETFLFNVLDTIGEEAIASALGELLVKPVQATEDDIYHAFLKHAPEDRKEAFNDLYRRLHGGSVAFSETEFSDDHGDESSTASGIVVGDVVNGTLDYMFDFDYFRFQAEYGQRYQIGIAHETLRLSSVELYDARGRRVEGWLSKWEDRDRVPYGPQIRWVAPSSGVYYFAVQNFGGKSGPYSFSITPVASVSDDHGDNGAAATDITVGDIVESAIDYAFDFDFFRFQVVAGQQYKFRINGVTLPYSRVRLYESDGVTWTGLGATQSIAEDGVDTYFWPGNTTSRWVAPSAGVYYLAVEGAFDSVGTYSLLVSESNSN